MLKLTIVENNVRYYKQKQFKYLRKDIPNKQLQNKYKVVCRQINLAKPREVN